MNFTHIGMHPGLAITRIVKKAEQVLKKDSLEKLITAGKGHPSLRNKA